MKSLSNLFFIIFFLIIYQNSAYSLTDYQIKSRCRKNKNSLICIRNLKSKKNKLMQGNRIEIPVIPFKN